MADVTLNTLNRTRQTTAAGAAGLFGLFAGLCATFAGCVTLSDWYTETTQARWPLVSAVIDDANVAVSKRGNGELWRLNTRVRYDINGQTWTARLTSRTVYSEQQAAGLQDW